MRKRLLCMLLTLSMVLSLVPVLNMTADAATGLTLQELKAKFPAGRYWNGNNPNGTTNRACTVRANGSHPDVGDSDLGSSPGDNYWCGACQCYGFALKVAYDACGITSQSYWGDVGFKKLTGASALNSLKPGDIIRVGGETNGHSVFVTEVNGDSFKYGDCNYLRGCGIRWDVSGTKTAVRNGTFHGYSFSYILSAPQTLVTNSKPTNVNITLNKTSLTLGESVTVTPSATGASKFTMRICYGQYGEDTTVFSDFSGFTGSKTYTPTKAGTYIVRVSAINDAGYWTDAECTFTVVQLAPTNVSISLSSNNISLGDSISINPSATGVHHFTMRVCYERDASDTIVFSDYNGFTGTKTFTPDRVGTYYVFVSAYSEAGYWADAQCSFTVQGTREMTLNNKQFVVGGAGFPDFPSVIARGSAVQFSGQLDANCEIGWVWAGVDSSTVYHEIQTSMNPTAPSVQISDLASQLDFTQLPVGKHTFKIEAMSGGQYFVVYTRDFEVVEPNMTYSGDAFPSKMLAGSNPDLAGTVSANAGISWLWMGVFYAGTHTQVLATSINPCNTSYDIAQLSKQLDFSALNEGDYKLTIEGICGDQYFVVYESNFSIVNEMEPTNPFTDVVIGKFYYDPVLWAISQDPQITTGVTDTTFMPDRICTRAHVVTFLWRANGCPEPTNLTSNFKDVKDTNKYYYKAVLWASENGITTGYSDGTFRPDDECTRGQVVTFLWRAKGEPKPVSTSNPFTDVPNGKYYTTAILWALENDITKGRTATTFGPDDACTRGHVVTFLYRAYAD